MFSVVIPVYNCEKSIISAIESVLSQTRVDLVEEILIVNDGSTDATDAVIRQYLTRKTPCPIRYFSQRNHGVSHSRNFAIRQAKAPWIALLDADDMWRANKLERQFEVIESEPSVRLLGTQARSCGTLFPKRVFFRSLKGLKRLEAKTLCIRAFFATSSIVFHRETGLKFGLFNEAMQYCEDQQFFQKFVLCDGCYVLAEDLVAYDCFKDFSGQSGLSSHLREMHLGRNECVRDFARMGLISPLFARGILLFNNLKYIRRVGICALKRIALEVQGGGREALSSKSSQAIASFYFSRNLTLSPSHFSSAFVVFLSQINFAKQFSFQGGGCL